MNREENWQVLVEEYDIVNQIDTYGYCILTAQEIKDATNAEPRLMCSMNTKKEVPKILDLLGISCLPIANGVFKLTRANAMVRVPLLMFTTHYPLRRIDDFISLEGPLAKKNETDLLAIAESSNMLSDAFGETVSSNMGGRKRGWFDFILDKELFEVAGVQIEIDGYYETTNAIHIVEVKKGDIDFLSVRQILYAKRLAEGIAKGRKPVHAWLMTFDKHSGYFKLFYFEEKDGTYSFNEKLSKKYILKEKEGLKCVSMNV